MIQQLEERYDGVLCLCCRQPIPLPAIINHMGLTSARPDGERSDRVFTLRCRACDKEMPYRASEIVKIEGTPKPRMFRVQDRSKLLRKQDGMSRAANG